MLAQESNSGSQQGNSYDSHSDERIKALLADLAAGKIILSGGPVPPKLAEKLYELKIQISGCGQLLSGNVIERFGEKVIHVKMVNYDSDFNTGITEGQFNEIKVLVESMLGRAFRMKINSAMIERIEACEFHIGKGSLVPFVIRAFKPKSGDQLSVMLKLLERSKPLLCHESREY